MCSITMWHFWIFWHNDMQTFTSFFQRPIKYNMIYNNLETLQKCGFVWANRPLRAHDRAGQIPLFINFDCNQPQEKLSRKEYTNTLTYCLHTTGSFLPHSALHSAYYRFTCICFALIGVRYCNYNCFIC